MHCLYQDTKKIFFLGKKRRDLGPAAKCTYNNTMWRARVAAVAVTRVMFVVVKSPFCLPQLLLLFFFSHDHDVDDGVRNCTSSPQHFQ